MSRTCVLLEIRQMRFADVYESWRVGRLTQEEIAQRMGTTQQVISRLESGRTKPSTRTLERYAEATGTRLMIGFAPVSD